MIGFFRRHPHLIDQAVPISEWAIHQFTESLREHPAAQKRRPRFTLKGRSGARVIDAVEQYFQQFAERAQARRESTWPARHWDADLEVGGVRWTIRELTSGRDLVEESAAMRHCVAAYWPACEQRKCAIFSFRTENQRTLTVEVDPATCVVRQARGFANRPARPAELAAVETWRSHVHSLITLFAAQLSNT
ncbi:MAG TPA: hypothetical protein DCE44_16250 [Verrucomicrobiales bacterium]|nr:hypothetical protein [Verrucomicrobiales bacterium]